MLKNLFFKSEQDPADAYYQALKAWQVDPKQNFIDVKNRIGLEAATSYVQLYFDAQKNYKRLRRELELHQNESNRLNSECDVIIIAPPIGFLQQEAHQRSIRQCRGLAMSAGFGHVSQAELNTGNALEGARRLLRLIKEKVAKGRPIVLVSFSFGSAFVRVMLDHLEEENLAGIKGWLNISGLISGSPRYHCSDRKNFASARNRELRSFSCEQTYFRKSFDSRSLKVVHMLGVRLKADLGFSDLKQRDYLKAWGPNDGMIPYFYYQNMRGPVISLLGQGHIIDMASVGSTFVRSLSAMVSTIPVEMPNFLLAKKPSFISGPQLR